ncbi:hypothetical protein SAMN05444166_5370 [Singulisphaera sp. GP187]|uniref:hypothetical protein n=1 Tax=Singulisphaera sp. GP187 TaxID=1882752 RepID=UPI00092C75F1|nr:hypothetical protein [Singulisphaera sp. GP187]SIO57264.1 hypothetical protein SAMN05444166_5370 [Singulisphaera sp. GP187]
MQSRRIVFLSRGLIALSLGAVLMLLNGCGGSAPAESATVQPAPKNRIEGIQRIGENNKKHQADIQKGAKKRRPNR